MTYNRKMLSLHFTPREVRATESRLLRVYEAAKLGLSNDALALRAGMMPEEFRKLCQLDPVVELAAMHNVAGCVRRGRRRRRQDGVGVLKT